MFLLSFISIYVSTYDAIKGCESQKTLYSFINEYDVHNFHKNPEKLLYSRCAPIAVLVSDGFYSTSSSYPNKASEASNVYPNDRHFCSFLLQIDTAYNEVCTIF